jgi:hypothetical protein
MFFSRLVSLLVHAELRESCSSQWAEKELARSQWAEEELIRGGQLVHAEMRESCSSQGVEKELTRGRQCSAKEVTRGGLVYSAEEALLASIFESKDESNRHFVAFLLPAALL